MSTTVPIRLLLTALVATAVVAAGPAATASTTDSTSGEQTPVDTFPDEERDYCVVVWGDASEPAVSDDLTPPPRNPTRVVCKDRYPNVPEWLEPPHDGWLPIDPVEPLTPTPIDPPRIAT